MRKKLLLGLLMVFVLTNIVWAHAGHEHASNAPIHVKWGLTGMNELQNLHPVIVHFPIALLTVSVLFYLLGAFLKKENFFFAGKWLLYFGTASAAVAVWTGLQAANSVWHDEEAHLIMMPHQYLGIGILILSFIFSLWLLVSKSNIPTKGRLIFLIGMILLGAAIAQQADFGGRLVYLKGVGVGKKKMAMQNMTDHSQHQ